MSIDWNTFWSALIGTTLPALVASLFMLLLTHRTNKALAHLKSDLEKRSMMFSVWHQKRIEALVEIYEAFRHYLKFLRRALYMPQRRESLDSMWEFNASVERNLVYLDSTIQCDIQLLQGELLKFFNWAHDQHKIGKKENIKKVQQRLDFEIPVYLEKVRNIINAYASPDEEIKPGLRSILQDKLTNSEKQHN